MMYDYYNIGPWGMFGFGWIFIVIFWVLLIWLIIALIRGLSHGHYHHDHYHDQKWHMDGMKKNEMNQDDRLLAILKERYAKGEISKDEYEEKKRELIR